MLYIESNMDWWLSKIDELVKTKEELLEQYINISTEN